MKILITGAGGFVGKRLTQYIAKLGHEVVAIVHSLPAKQDCYFFSEPNITLLEHDLANFNSTLLPSDIDVIFILAQSAYFRDFPEKAEDIYKVNIEANFKLLQWAYSNQVKKIIYASSGGIYGRKYGTLFDEQDMFTLNSPLGFYLSSKLCTEVLLQNYIHLFDSVVIFRPFFIYGPGQRKDMLIMRLIESVKEGIPIILQGQEGLKLNPIYVDDAVRVFAKAIESTGAHIFNLAGPDILTLRRVVEIISEVCNKEAIFTIKNETPADYVGNNERVTKEFKQELTSFSEGISLTMGAEDFYK